MDEQVIERSAPCQRKSSHAIELTRTELPAGRFPVAESTSLVVVLARLAVIQGGQLGDGGVDIARRYESGHHDETFVAPLAGRLIDLVGHYVTVA